MAQQTFNFKDEGLEENLIFFIADQPIPIGIGDKPALTPGQWWRRWVIKNTKQAIQRGKNKLSIINIDEDIIT